MSVDHLQYDERPKACQRMVLGFSGWMDGGDVSTGTIECLVTELGARQFAKITPDDFYVQNFPGSMEVASLFRPHVRIKEGVVESFELPSNTFYHVEQHKLILFEGREPNFHWAAYANCIFGVASQFQVREIYFVGSVGGLVPHTREPRLFSTVSDANLKPVMQQYGLRFTNYEGPGSIISYLLQEAKGRNVAMTALVAEIPPYVEGRNVRCIESVVRKLMGILDVPIKLDEMRMTSDELERRLNEIVNKRPELAKHIRKLEEDYDNDVFAQMGDLQSWLEQQGIRLD